MLLLMCQDLVVSDNERNESVMKQSIETREVRTEAKTHLQNRVYHLLPLLLPSSWWTKQCVSGDSECWLARGKTAVSMERNRKCPGL